MTQLSPEEFRRIREALDLSQSQMASMLGYSSHVRISELENGKKAITDTVTRLMLSYMSGYRPDDWPKKTPPRI